MSKIFILIFFLSLQDGILLNATSLINSFSGKAFITDFFTLYWEFPDSDLIHMGIRWNTGGFFSIGFGLGMNNVDMIVCEKLNGEIKISDRWATGQSTPEEDSTLGGRNDLVRTGFNFSDEDGWSIVTFKRKLSTSDKYDYNITKEKTIMEYAFSSSPILSYHGSNKQGFIVEFIEDSNQTADLLSLEEENYRQAHAIGLLIVWTFLVEIPLIIARYFKHFKYYIVVHASSFFILGGFTLIMSFIMIGENANIEKKYEADSIIVAHYICGYIIISLIIVEAALGILTKILIESRKYVNFSQNLGLIKKTHMVHSFLLKKKMKN